MAGAAVLAGSGAFAGATVFFFAALMGGRTVSTVAALGEKSQRPPAGSYLFLLALLLTLFLQLLLFSLGEYPTALLGVVGGLVSFGHAAYFGLGA